MKLIMYIDKGVDKIIVLFFLLLFLIGAYAIYDTVLSYNDSAGDFRTFRPLAGETWDMSALSDDVVAWITVHDTKIDYPVMQGEDNNEYLNKDPYGKYALSGSIFLDSRNAPDFSDPYALLYGHHMEYGYMFGALDSYSNETYFDTHRTGILRVGDVTYNLNIFAYVEADASVMEIFAPTETNGTLDYVKSHAEIIRDMREGETIIGLSTCKHPETTERTIVFATISKSEESGQTGTE